MTGRLFRFASLLLGAAMFVYARPTGGQQRAPQAQGCVPGQQIACACVGGGIGVQQCNRDGASFGLCQGCSGQGAGPVECNLVGAWQLALSWQTAKCGWAFDKVLFVVSRSPRGFSIEDRSDGVSERTTLKAEKTASGCVLDIFQSIDPEGGVAGSKTVSVDKYVYRLVESHGVITGSGRYQSFEFSDTPACAGSFRVTGSRTPNGARR